MRTILSLLTLASAAQALFFFIDGATPKCFFEELPKGTLVVGHYAAEEWDDRVHGWQQHGGISIYISVDVSPTPRLPPPRVPHSSYILTHTHRKSLTMTIGSSPSAALRPANSLFPQPKLVTTRSASCLRRAPAARDGCPPTALTVASS